MRECGGYRPLCLLEQISLPLTVGVIGCGTSTVAAGTTSMTMVASPGLRLMLASTPLDIPVEAAAERLLL